MTRKRNGDALDRILDADLRRDPSQAAEVGRLRALKAGLDEPTADAVGEKQAKAYVRGEKRRRRRTKPLTDDHSVPSFLDALMAADQIRRVIDMLPEREREVLNAVLWDGVDTSKIALHQGLSNRSINRSRSNAVDRLRGLLEHDR